MPLGLPALALLALLQGGARPGAGTQTGPKRPTIAPPATPPAGLAEVRAWKGWKLGPILSYEGFAGPADLPIPPLDTPAIAGAVPFKLRVFVLARTDEAGADGRVIRRGIEGAGVERLRAAVANVRAVVRATTGGRVDLVPTITVDDEPARFDDLAAEEDYVRLRINGGRFDAEDGVDRGPFSGVLLVAPSPLKPGRAAGTAFVPVDFYAAGGEDGGARLEAALLDSTERLMADRLRDVGGVDVPRVASGGGASALPDLGAWLRDADLPLLRPGLDLSAPVLAAATAGAPSAPPTFAAAKDPTGPGTPATGEAVYLEPDPERGGVLRLRETGGVRRGRLALPRVAVPAGKALGFWIKVGSGDSAALRVRRGNGTSETTILGPVEAERGVPLALDGRWHRVVVSVPEDAAAMEIVPPRPGEARRDLAFANVWLDDFEWTSDAPTPLATGPGAEAFERAKGATGADLASSLADPSSAVRLAALGRVAKGDASLEAAVIRLAAGEIEPENARAAVAALGRLGTPGAIAAAKRALTLGPSEVSRQEAARVLAATGDPSLVTTIAILLGRPSWRSRLAAVEALGLYRQENAVRFRLSATLQENPELRYAALRPATVANGDERQKLLYAAINDPSDEIRAFACDRLLDSADPAVAGEGLRGTADDSPWVRLLLQRALARRASPAFRAAALRGVADPVGRVRGEALRALAALGLLDPAEVPNALNDPHPEVLLALVELARAGKILLPPATKALVAASRDRRLRP